VRSLGASETIASDDVRRGALGRGTIDAILDTVAGESFGAYVAALRLGATLSLVGAVGGSNVAFDVYRLLDVTLTGYSSESLDGVSLRRANRRDLKIAPIRCSDSTLTRHRRSRGGSRRS